MSPHKRTIRKRKILANRAAIFFANPRRLSFRATLVQEYWSMVILMGKNATTAFILG